MKKTRNPIKAIADPLCFWDFQDHGRGDLTSRGRYEYTLEERNGPIARADVGVFGPSCLDFERGQWLLIPRADCPGLDISGEREVSVVAWVQRQTDHIFQYIAGMWNETDGLRQYALFTSAHRQAHSTDLSRTDASHQPHGYVSECGGATPGCAFCFSYATAAETLEEGRWTMIGYTFDLARIRVYVDGELSENGDCNPFDWNEPIFAPTEGGSDFTVAQRAVPSWPTYPQGQPANPVGFGGLLGGLAVFDSALSAEQMRKLHALAKPGTATARRRRPRRSDGSTPRTTGGHGTPPKKPDDAMAPGPIDV